MIGILTHALARWRESKSLMALAVLSLVVFLSVSLQIQTDIADIRINLADPVLPLAGIGILAALLFGRSAWPRWDIPYSYLWLAGLSVWVGVSVLNGWQQHGEIMPWALYNKFAGFIVLVCYFALGGWFYRNRCCANVIGLLVSGFFLFYLVIYFGGFALMAGKAAGIQGLPRLFPFEGLMGNRNAYALLMMCGTIFLLVFARRVPGFLPRFVLPLYLFALPFVAIYNGSRAVWILLVLTGLYFVIRHFRWSLRHIIPALLCGALLATLTFTHTDQSPTKRKQIKRISKTISALQEKGPDILEDVSKQDKKVRQLASELIRVRNAKISIEIWRDHPLIGGGLGAILAYQNAHYDPQKVYIDIMDCTPLWLLAETGVIGLLAFSGFYILILRALWHKVRPLPADKNAAFSRVQPLEAAFAEALFLFMLAFGMMSLLHEILYTRYLWVMMGIGASSRPDTPA